MIEVIGLVGPFGSGKTKARGFFAENGYLCITLSDIIKDEARSRNLEISREVVMDLGNSLRREYGNNILAVRALERIREAQVSKSLIDGIRNPAELNYLKHEARAFIIGITLDPKLRFQRVLNRNLPGDPKTYEDFLEIDRRDSGMVGDNNSQQVNACIQLADTILKNDGDLFQFRLKLESFLKK